jgi:hypothetical protein
MHSLNDNNIITATQRRLCCNFACICKMACTSCLCHATCVAFDRLGLLANSRPFACNSPFSLVTYHSHQRRHRFCVCKNSSEAGEEFFPCPKTQKNFRGLLRTHGERPDLRSPKKNRYALSRCHYRCHLLICTGGQCGQRRVRPVGTCQCAGFCIICILLSLPLLPEVDRPELRGLQKWD